MPKLKTNRAAAKRFRFTSGGKVKFKKGFHNHILTCKNMKRKRRLRLGAILSEADLKEVRALMPYGGK